VVAHLVGVARGVAHGIDRSDVLESKRNDEYDWEIDSYQSWLLALETMRADYLANRKEGETAREFLDRKAKEK